MSPSRALFTSVRVDWATPKALYEALDMEFRFTLDPCPHAGVWDGLARSWAGERVYCNPPYGPSIGAWLEKHREPDVAVYLLPARTDTRWFHDFVLTEASDIRFLQGRLNFGDDPRRRATFPSMIVVYAGSPSPTRRDPEGGGEGAA